MGFLDKNYEEVYREFETRHFYFVARREIILSLIKKYSKKKGKVKVLDFGCGTGDMLRFLNKSINGEFVGIDASKNMLDMYQSDRRIKLIQGDIYKTKLKKAYFDIIICLDVIEHLKNDKGCLERINQLLNKDGLAIILAPAFMFLWSTHDVGNGHVRRYSKKEFENKTNLIEGNRRIFYWNAISFLPKLFAKYFFKNRMVKKGSSDIEMIHVPKILEIFVRSWLRMENWWLIKGFPLPLGISLVAVITKN